MAKKKSRAAATAALQVLVDAAVPHKVYSFAAGEGDYGAHAANELGLQLKISSNQVFKTLVIDLTAAKGPKRDLAVAVIPVSGSLSLKKAAAAFGVSKVVMAQPSDAQRSSGYIPGGISPIGQKRALPTVIDVSALEFAEVFVSGGKRGLDIAISPEDLAVVTHARFGELQA
ncbi:aminoacyl-tRNA deacylase [Corynebacterium freiburgense]|uniref:aminoacyl-tRNA deacylase n=1 Tax=Corynebacterium freiburgense TaxID=556548 RepID=UPI000417A322|nr:aminoacyl-tRNA deacylase [Corynebacterium freiburgense]WJZ01934.1 Cys-tRNA(Pro)/Cys-tRNA(Cys) deacylase YbaK [Corynebacterium freiburgense]